MMYLGNNEKKKALDVIEQAINDVEAVSPVSTTVFRIERERSIEQLKGTLEQLADFKVGELEQLEAELETAVQDEDYERAMELRDKITTLRNKK